MPNEQLTYKNGLKVLKESGEPFTGMALIFDGREIPNKIIEYKNGKLDGRIQVLYPDGELKEEYYARLEPKFYKAAKLFTAKPRRREPNRLDEVADRLLIRYGEEQRWYDNGEIKSQGQYSVSGGVKTGTWKQWYKNGNLYTEQNYDTEGKADGVWKTYCENETLGKKLEYRQGVLHGLKQYWGCDGTALDQANFVAGKQQGQYVVYRHKNGDASLAAVADNQHATQYNINAADYYKYAEGSFTDGLEDGIWTIWNRDGSVASVIDFKQDNFINPEYLKKFLVKGRLGSYYRHNYRSKQWRLNDYNFVRARPDVEEIRLLLQNKWVDPTKKIPVKKTDNSYLYQNKSGMVRWTYAIVAAPEALYEMIKNYPGVKLNAVNTEGQNRLHLCTTLMFANKPGRCSFEHFNELLNEFPLNAEDKNGRSAINIITANSYRKHSIKQAAMNAVTALSKAGADINHKNKAGLSALMEALLHNEYQLAETLINLGSDVNALDAKGRNMMHYVFIESANTWRGVQEKYRFRLNERRKKILKLLALKGVKVHQPALKNGDNLIDLASKAGAAKTFEFLNTLSDIKTPQPVTLEKPDEQQPAAPKKQAVAVVEQPNAKTDAAVGEEAVLNKPVVDETEKLYQKALAQIKQYRLSRPKGDSALDTMNELALITSSNDKRVNEIRSKIASKYLMLARSRMNDYRYQDARRFIQTSQSIQKLVEADRLLNKVNRIITEEKRFYQQNRPQPGYSTQPTSPPPPSPQGNEVIDFFNNIFN